MPSEQRRSRLNSAFVAAVLASPIPNHALARRSGFAHSQHFSSLLHAVAVVASPRTVARLHLVAQIIGFEGDLILEDLPAAPRKGDRFDADHLPVPTLVRR